jgi:hypothetical protein
MIGVSFIHGGLKQSGELPRVCELKKKVYFIYFIYQVL